MTFLERLRVKRNGKEQNEISKNSKNGDVFITGDILTGELFLRRLMCYSLIMGRLRDSCSGDISARFRRNPASSMNNSHAS